MLFIINVHYVKGKWWETNSILPSNFLGIFFPLTSLSHPSTFQWCHNSLLTFTTNLFKIVFYTCHVYHLTSYWFPDCFSFPTTSLIILLLKLSLPSFSGHFLDIPHFGIWHSWSCCYLLSFIILWTSFVFYLTGFSFALPLNVRSNKNSVMGFFRSCK